MQAITIICLLDGAEYELRLKYTDIYNQTTTYTKTEGGPVNTLQTQGSANRWSQSGQRLTVFESARMIVIGVNGQQLQRKQLDKGAEVNLKEFQSRVYVTLEFEDGSIQRILKK